MNRIMTILGLALLFFTESAFAREDINEVLDSLMTISGRVCFNREGLPVINRLEEVARETNNSRALDRALECKACIFINENMHNELQAFCDSVDANTDMQTKSPYAYYYLVYTRGISYIRQGKFHLAINLAQQMYDYGKQQMEKDRDNEERYPRDMEIYVQGVDILSNSYMEIGKPEIALEYCTESRDLCLSLNDGVSEISNNMLTASYTRLSAANDMYEFTDGAKLLEYVDSFRADLDLWVSRAADSVYVSAIEPYYRSTIEYLSLVAYTQLKDWPKWTRSMIRFCAW